MFFFRLKCSILHVILSLFKQDVVNACGSCKLLWNIVRQVETFCFHMTKSAWVLQCPGPEPASCFYMSCSCLKLSVNKHTWSFWPRRNAHNSVFEHHKGTQAGLLFWAPCPASMLVCDAIIPNTTQYPTDPWEQSLVLNVGYVFE